MASSSSSTSINPVAYNSLTRSNTSNIKTSKANSAFGSSLLMNREDHERERVRWQQRLDETENRLAEAEMTNSEMNQLKAELNKRIVEMERNQKPLIEQNRRLSERNRLLQNEIKKGEQRLCHSQDDFLTLKDGYEKLVKENQTLKEKRAFPEKLEELDRYRNQVLEYSKCITALRQSSLESLARRKGHDKMIETDKWIAEDGDDKELLQIALTLDQTCDLKRDLLQLYKSANLDDCQRKNIRQAKLYIEFLENGLLEMGSDGSTKIKDYELKKTENDILIADLREQIQGLRSVEKQKMELEVEVERLHTSVAALNQEKQVLLDKISENSSEVKKPMFDNTANNEGVKDLEKELMKKLNATDEQKASLLHRIEALEKEKQELLMSRTELQQEMNVLTKSVAESNDRISSLTKANQDAKIEQNALTGEINALSKELGKVRYCMQQKDGQITSESKKHAALKCELEMAIKNHINEIEELRTINTHQKEAMEEAKEKLARICQEKADIEEMNSKLRERMNALIEENQKLKEEIRPAIKTQLERRFEESRFRLNSALQTIHEHENEIAKLRTQVDELQQKLNDRNKIESDLVQAREYSEQLQKQFSTQALIIDALKEKIILHKNFDDVLSAAIDECEQSCEDIENKLGILCQSKENNLTHESIALLRRLIRNFSQWNSNSCVRSGVCAPQTKAFDLQQMDTQQ